MPLLNERCEVIVEIKRRVRKGRKYDDLFVRAVDRIVELIAQIDNKLLQLGVVLRHPYKALGAFGMLRSLHSIEAVDYIHAHQGRINQGVLGRHGVSSYTLHLNGSAASVKGLDRKSVV